MIGYRLSPEAERVQRWSADAERITGEVARHLCAARTRIGQRPQAPQRDSAEELTERAAGSLLSLVETLVNAGESPCSLSTADENIQVRLHPRPNRPAHPGPGHSRCIGQPRGGDEALKPRRNMSWPARGSLLGERAIPQSRSNRAIRPRRTASEVSVFSTRCSSSTSMTSERATPDTSNARAVSRHHSAKRR